MSVIIGDKLPDMQQVTALVWEQCFNWCEKPYSDYKYVAQALRSRIKSNFVLKP